MPSRKVQIDILGPRPNEVDIEDLARILDDLRTAISSCIQDVPDEKPGWTGTMVSLVGIVEGSDGLVLEVQPLAAASLSRISRSLRTRVYDDIPRTAHEALYKINQFTSKRSWGLRIRKNESLAIDSVEMITPSHVVAPESRKTISGQTTLLARCLRVGGATKPKAELRLARGSLLHVEVTESVARELGKRLYDEVVLHGNAVWDAQDGEIRDLSVFEVASFRAVSPIAAFKALADASRGRWKDIDAERYVQKVRGDHE